jgi:hypothetical protein
MINKTTWLQLVLAFTGGAVVYWTIPYDQLALNSIPFFIRWAMPMLIVGFIGTAVLKHRVLISAGLTVCSAVLVVLARIIYDTLLDASSHNLLPLEVMVTGIFAFVASLTGSFAGTLILKKRLD